MAISDTTNEFALLEAAITTVEAEIDRKRQELAHLSSDPVLNLSSIAQQLESIARAEGKLQGLRHARTIVFQG